MSVTLASGRERGQGIFAHDTEVALAGAAALVNTGRGGTEQLPDVAALDRYVAEWELTGSRTHDQAELDGVRRLRARLERLWEMDKDDAAELVNTMLRDGSALPQLVKHGGWDYHLHATPPDAPLADRLAVDTAMALADVIRTGQLERLRLCAAADCDNVHVDLSKNRSRRFCGTSCANRVNVAAYRTRQAERRVARLLSKGGGVMPVAIGVWFGIVGALVALAGLTSRQRARRLWRDGVSVWATVVPAPASDVPGSTYAQYALPDGRVLERPIPSRAVPLHPGEKVLIWYDPADPGEMLVRGRDTRVSDGVFMLSGALLILVATGIGVFAP
jgi:predicted RNA-binding Zn ribbon-like protein